GSVWSTADSFQFYQEPRTGDFDVKLRMVSLVGGNYNARLGIMAREHPGNNSRYLSVVAYQPNQANLYAFLRRPGQGGGSDTWGSNLSGVTPPNAWVRLRRTGDVFQAFISTDGSSWTQGAETTFALPETLLVGFFVSSEDTNLSRSAAATIDEWGEYSPVILREPQSQTVFQGQTARLGVEARGVGELAYQWYFEGAVLPGATAAVLELANIQPVRAGSYHVTIQNSIGSVTSQAATVVVDTSDPGAGFEADLMPRESGDGTVGVADWTMVGRFAVGLEDPANASEFARADCAPRTTLGNGVIGIADWVQAGRYAAGLDPKTAAGGPNGISPLGERGLAGVPTAARQIALTALPSPADTVRVAVRLLALGNENSVGFSLGFDASALEYSAVVAGSGAAGALVMNNSTRASEGGVGVALALPAGGRLRTGDIEVAVVEFKRRLPGDVELRLRGTPVAIEAASALAEPLALEASAAAYSIRDVGAGVLQVSSGVEAGGVLLEFTGQQGDRVVLEASADLASWAPVGNETVVDDSGTIQFAQEAGGSHRFFRIRKVD
ncbi:MAG: hypothetical protein KDM81_09395, partial [Verrucomicrobiae bacterium]|nr:hypothetical protein [Verrucomicrobiae bacterium]